MVYHCNCFFTVSFQTLCFFLFKNTDKVKSEDLLSNLYVKRGANFHLKLIGCKRILDNK